MSRDDEFEAIAQTCLDLFAHIAKKYNVEVPAGLTCPIHQRLAAQLTRAGYVVGGPRVESEVVFGLNPQFTAKDMSALIQPSIQTLCDVQNPEGPQG